jgi:hypothetical protein
VTGSPRASLKGADRGLGPGFRRRRPACPCRNRPRSGAPASVPTLCDWVRPVSSGPKLRDSGAPPAQPRRHVADADPVIGRRVVAQDRVEVPVEHPGRAARATGGMDRGGPMVRHLPRPRRAAHPPHSATDRHGARDCPGPFAACVEPLRADAPRIPMARPAASCSARGSWRWRPAHRSGRPTRSRAARRRENRRHSPGRRSASAACAPWRRPRIRSCGRSSCRPPG